MGLRWPGVLIRVIRWALTVVFVSMVVQSVLVWEYPSIVVFGRRVSGSHAAAGTLRCVSDCV